MSACLLANLDLESRHEDINQTLSNSHFRGMGNCRSVQATPRRTHRTCSSRVSKSFSISKDFMLLNRKTPLFQLSKPLSHVRKLLRCPGEWSEIHPCCLAREAHWRQPWSRLVWSLPWVFGMFASCFPNFTKVGSVYFLVPPRSPDSENINS